MDFALPYAGSKALPMKTSWRAQ